jgi:hypothetical protein
LLEPGKLGSGFAGEGTVRCRKGGLAAACGRSARWTGRGVGMRLWP